MSAPRSKSRKRSSASLPRSRARGPVVHSFAFETVALDAEGRAVDRRPGCAQQLVQPLGKGVALHLVQIPGGTFMMGAADDEAEAKGTERPRHPVTVAPFYLGRYPVTIDQWRTVTGSRPAPMKFAESSFKKSGRQPVVRVSFDEVQEFCARLARKTRCAFRLPSEAEWEYACRAGTSSAFAFGPAISRDVVIHGGEAIRVANPNGAHTTTRPVGSLRIANAFGLSDMHGHVWEWCEDWWHKDYQGAPADGSAWKSDGEARNRVMRGGSWYSAAELCRSASRHIGGEAGIRSRQIGLRVALTL